MATLIHASDIANGAMRYKTYFKWSALLTQEFHHQFLCEQKRGLEPTAFHRYAGLADFYKGQIFFLGGAHKASS